MCIRMTTNRFPRRASPMARDGGGDPRVVIFWQKNYSAKFGTSRKERQFRRNSASFAEEKNLGIPFRTISRKRKTLGIPFRTNSRKRNTIGIPLRTISRKRKPSEFRSEPYWLRITSEFRSEPFSEQKKLQNSVLNYFRKKKLGKKTTFVSCFIKLQYFAEFRSVLFCSELWNSHFRNTRNHTEWALYSAE